MPRIEIDGFPPTPDELAIAALDNYGHFTAMQVRNLCVRGLDLHLKRLVSAHVGLFGTSLDAELVRTRVGHALSSGAPDASVRVYVRQVEDRPSIMVTVREAGDMPGGGQPWRLQSVPYQRPAAQLKRFSDFGQAYYQRLVAKNGFDEALLTGPDGQISEGSVTNIGFIAGNRITWPSAPMLAGVTMQLIEAKFRAAGLGPARQEIRLSDLREFDGAFVCNARGIALVGQIDDVMMPADPRWMTMITKVYESVEWDQI